MSPQPSPLSLGPPLGSSNSVSMSNTPTNSPKDTPNHDSSVPGPPKEPINHRANRLSQSVVLPPLRVLHPPNIEGQRTSSYPHTGPPTMSRLDILCEFLTPRFHNPMHIKVIAVGGGDAETIGTMIEKLQHHIIKDLHYTVRALGHEFCRVSHLQPPDLSTFRGSIECWKTLWEVIIHTSLSTSNSESREAPPGQSIPRTAVFDQKPCVYILPISPLMATLKASKSTELQCNSSPMIWRWLASHWSGHRRPDIIINIQESVESHMTHGVVRVDGNSMRTLVVMQPSGKGLDLTKSQLRRVVFEVEDLLDTGV